MEQARQVTQEDQDIADYEARRDLARNYVFEVRRSALGWIDPNGNAEAWHKLAEHLDDQLRTLGMACFKPHGFDNAMLDSLSTLVGEEAEHLFMDASLDYFQQHRTTYGENTASWNVVLSDAEGAFWKHAGLVWLIFGQAVRAGVESDRVRDCVMPECLQPTTTKTEPVKAALSLVTKNAESEIPNTPKVEQDITPSNDVPTTPQAQASLPVDGDKLHKSIVPTWLVLVGLSWVSLFWGALISVPFGLGVGIFAMSFVGMVAVPLWGSLFGFFGMNAAKASTLDSLKFEPVADDHPLAQKAAAYCDILAMPTPKVGTINVHNAIAMGASREDATVALGTPLMQQLSEDEQFAVLGHELGHVVNGDMRRMMLMRTFQNACVWFMMAQKLKHFARWVICWAAELNILAFSRRREFHADAVGAALAGKEAMIGALRKLSDGPDLSDSENSYARFMFRGRAKAMFSTHPSIEDRIAVLENELYLSKLPLRQAL